MRLYTIKNFIICFLIASFFVANPVIACDDTLVMLLTDKNPTSEFSKSIRSFMNSLTVLGSSLKYNPKDDYESELEGVLNSWLEFSKKYMTNPPEEAKNDQNWVAKMSSTARKIGEIRKLVNNKKYLDAHNNVLELSNTIGTFFEAAGLSKEKQVFLATSADINDLQRLAESKSNLEFSEKINKLKADLEEFKKYIKVEDDFSVASNTAIIIESLSQVLVKNESSEEIDNSITKLRTSFEELRSRILMQEWFSDNEAEVERK